MDTPNEGGTDGFLPTEFARECIRAVAQKAEDLVGEALLGHTHDLQKQLALLRRVCDPTENLNATEVLKLSEMIIEGEIQWLRKAVLAFRRPLGNT